MKKKEEKSENKEKPVNIEEEAAKILKIFDEKGWALYYRGPVKAKVSDEETFERGPVSSLQKGIIYILQPKVDNPKDEDVLREFINKHNITFDTAKLRVPPNNSGRAIHEFIEIGRIRQKGNINEEHKLNPGQEVSFIGIELQEKEVWVLSNHKTSLPYDVFRTSLSALIDISKLK